jgi:hypothetical protein
MPWRDGTGPPGRGPRAGRGGGSCKGTGRAGALGDILGSLAVGLLAWGGQALSRRFSAARPLRPPEAPSPLETAACPPAIGAGEQAAELAELRERARWLARELEVVRQRIQTLEREGTR